MSKTTPQGVPVLLTNDAKLAYVHELVKKADHPGKLFHPPAVWYSQPPTAEHLEQVLKQLCKWVGVKPRHLDVSFVDLGETAGSYLEDDDGHHLHINHKYAHKSYQALAIATHEFVHYLLKGRWHITLEHNLEQEELVDLLSIYLGFGPIILNGLERYETWPQRFAAYLGFLTPLRLGASSAAEYARQLVHFTASNPLCHEDELYSQLAPWSRRHFTDRLPKHVKTAHHIAFAEKRVKNGNLVFVGTLLLAGVISALVVFIVQQRPAHPSASLATKKEQADTLYNSYVLCKQTFESRKASMPQADILQQQNLNADATRCLSLQNQYNAIVDSYNQELHAR